ncbi:MAG: helix-turn-helix transcriptional regulator [Lachnospiraceae bacterium]|nr:helix-turn-helix transcriptional regulator [Lachnospiraceae bacterium]
MPKPNTLTGEKNLIGARVVTLRKRNRLSQRDLANKLQLLGMDMDKNVITRIETGKRFVTDFEILALVKVFDVPYEYLFEGKE